MNRWRVVAWIGFVLGVAGILLRDLWLPGAAEPRTPPAPAPAAAPAKSTEAPAEPAPPAADDETKAAAPRPGPRPGAKDVVLITLDTVRADFLQPYGASVPTSPFLAALSKRGVTFQNAYATSNWTTPSMASLMTSLYPREHDLVLALASVGRAQQRALPAEAVTLAEMLRAQGYDTFGVTTNLLLTRRYGFDQGFDHFLGEVTAQMPFPRIAVESLHDAITESEASFLWVHYFDPHWPYLEQAPWFQTWNDSGFGGVGDFAADVAAQMYRRENSLPPDARIPPQAIAGSHLRTQGWALDPTGLLAGIPEMASGAGGVQAVDAYLRYLRAAYRSELRAVDADLERVLEGLGVDEDTLVIVTADHGEEFLEHGKLGHGSFSLHQELIRVPLIVRLPGGRHAGKVIEAPVSLIDIAPSLMELLELPVPEGLSGRSFADLLGGASAGEPRNLVAERSGASGEAHRCVIRYPWKYVHDFQTGDGLLYHLEDDPGERHDLVAEQPKRAAELRTWLTGWATETGRRWPEREPAVMSPTDVLMLRALGYAGAD